MRACRLGIAILVGSLLSACATSSSREQTRNVYQQGVQQQLLDSVDDAAVGSAAVQRYQPSAQERFRMPLALTDSPPQLAKEQAQRELAPTRVCARVAIAADGSVMFAENLSARSECMAGANPENAALVEAMLSAVRTWQFRPAALCRYPAESVVNVDDSDCAGASEVQAVPVTLEYGFTFAIHEGRVLIERDRAAR